MQVTTCQETILQINRGNIEETAKHIGLLITHNWETVVQSDLIHFSTVITTHHHANTVVKTMRYNDILFAVTATASLSIVTNIRWVRGHDCSWIPSSACRR